MANFQLLIEHVIALGPTYNPGNAAISLASLQAKFTEATAAMQSHRAVKTNFDIATNAREIQFKNLQSTTTRVINALVASGASSEVIKDARTLVRKLRGSRSAAPKTPAPEGGTNNTEGTQEPPPPGNANGPKPKTVSVSQRSYDQMTENFSKLVQLVQAEPAYDPNEVDLVGVALNNYASELFSKTNAVHTHVANYATSIAQRNEVLYARETGLPALAHSVKAYVKSVYGASSPQYKTVSGVIIKQVKK